MSTGGSYLNDDLPGSEGFLGGYTGGGLADSLDGFVMKMGTGLMGDANPNASRWIGILILFIIIFIALEVAGVLSCGPAHSLGLLTEGMVGDPGLAYCSGRSDNDLPNLQCKEYVERFPGEEGAYESVGGYGSIRQDNFVNSRETPHFSDVTNRVLRMENREKEAIRALAKINQERIRRQAERPDATVPWDTHWNEWKLANPMVEEQMV